MTTIKELNRAIAEDSEQDDEQVKDYDFTNDEYRELDKKRINFDRCVKECEKSVRGDPDVEGERTGVFDIWGREVKIGDYVIQSQWGRISWGRVCCVNDDADGLLIMGPDGRVDSVSTSCMPLTVINEQIDHAMEAHKKNKEDHPEDYV